MSTPCAKYGTVGDVAFMLLTMGMLDIVEDIGEKPGDALVFLAELSVGAIANAVPPQDVERMSGVAALKLASALDRAELSPNEAMKAFEKFSGDNAKFLSEIHGETKGEAGKADYSTSGSDKPFDNPDNRINTYMLIRVDSTERNERGQNVVIRNVAVNNESQRSAAQLLIDNGGAIVSINQKIVSGPDRGIHRGVKIENTAKDIMPDGSLSQKAPGVFETGVMREIKGTTYRGTNEERP